MKQTWQRFWLFIVPILMLGFLLNGTVDVQMHDTYYVISKFHITLFFCIFLFASGLGYLLFEKIEKNKRLRSVHFWCTIVGLVFLWIYLMVFGTYLNIGINAYNLKQISPILASLLLLIIGAFAYLINIAKSLLG